MSWVPPVLPQQRWLPQDETESDLIVANRNILMPGIQDKSVVELDLSQNVSFGRKPYTFRFLAHNFPAGVFVEEGGLLRVLDDAPLVLGGDYSAVVEVRDANNQTTTFTVRTGYYGIGPLVVGGGPIPAAHVGVPFLWRPVVYGGAPPYRFVLRGVDLPALGFKFDVPTGQLGGTYNGSLGNSPGNLFAVQVWNRSLEPDGYPSTGFDAEYVTTWDLLDP